MTWQRPEVKLLDGLTPKEIDEKYGLVPADPDWMGNYSNGALLFTALASQVSASNLFDSDIVDDWFSHEMTWADSSDEDLQEKANQHLYELLEKSYPIDSLAMSWALRRGTVSQSQLGVLYHMAQPSVSHIIQTMQARLAICHKLPTWDVYAAHAEIDWEYVSWSVRPQGPTSRIPFLAMCAFTLYWLPNQTTAASVLGISQGQLRHNVQRVLLGVPKDHPYRICYYQFPVHVPAHQKKANSKELRTYLGVEEWCRGGVSGMELIREAAEVYGVKLFV